jgi:hypothetical protein
MVFGQSLIQFYSVSGLDEAQLAPKQARFEHDRGRRSCSQSLAIFPTLIVAH